MTPAGSQKSVLQEILKAILTGGKLEAAGFDHLFELGRSQLAKLEQSMGRSTPGPQTSQAGKGGKEEQSSALWENNKTLLGKTQAGIDPQGRLEDAHKGWEKTLDELAQQEKALAEATAKAAVLNARVLEAVNNLAQAQGRPGLQAARQQELHEARGHRDRAEEAVNYEKEKRDALGRRAGEARQVLAGEQESANSAPRKPPEWAALRNLMGDGEGAAAEGIGGEAAAGAAEAGGAEAVGAAGGPGSMALLAGKAVLKKVKNSFDELGKAWGSEKFGDVGSHLAKSSEIVTGMFGKLAAKGFESIERLRKWNEELHESNMEFAEWSGAMAAVQARQEVRDIELSMRRGDSRAEDAERLAKSKHDLNETLAPAEDMWAKFKMIQTAITSEAVKTLLQKVLPGIEIIGEALGVGNAGQPGVNLGKQLEEAGKGEWTKAYGKKREFGDLADPVTGKK